MMVYVFFQIPSVPNTTYNCIIVQILENFGDVFW